MSSPEDTTPATTTDAPGTDVAVVEPVRPLDEVRTALADAFAAELGDGLVAQHLKPGDDLWLRVTAAAWVTAGTFARHKLNCRYFGFLSAIDWRPSPFGRYEESEIDNPVLGRLGADYELAPGYTGGDTRFQVFARVADIDGHRSFTLKVDVPDETLTLDSWATVYAGANWHERETWEMFGINFAGHPDMRHIYLPGEFEGFPLRKDFPLLARIVKPWPGIVDVEPMPGEEPAAAGELTAEGGDE
ncbi:MAG: NADH-quinone oxidoreductase subunit C [Acidimicrobiia bacterium]